MKKEIIYSTILMIFSVLICYLFLEIGFRAYKYFQLSYSITKYIQKIKTEKVSVFGSEPQAISDEKVGYRYAANFSKKADKPFPIDWQTNSYGHPSRKEYPVIKPDNEFRIAVIGDSMSANEVNTVRWADLLEDSLNHSKALS